MPRCGKPWCTTFSTNYVNQGAHTVCFIFDVVCFMVTDLCFAFYVFMLLPIAFVLCLDIPKWVTDLLQRGISFSAYFYGSIFSMERYYWVSDSESWNIGQSHGVDHRIFQTVSVHFDVHPARWCVVHRVCMRAISLALSATSRFAAAASTLQLHATGNQCHGRSRHRRSPRPTTRTRVDNVNKILSCIGVCSIVCTYSSPPQTAGSL